MVSLLSSIGISFSAVIFDSSVEHKTSELDRGLGRSATELDLLSGRLNGGDKEWLREIRATFLDGEMVKMELEAAIFD